MNVVASIGLVVAAAGIAAAQCQPPNVLLVNAAAPPGGNGLTWATAFDKLELAIGAAGASSGQYNEIWLAQGTYRPPPPAGMCVGYVASNVSLYGGFAGNECARGQRPPTTTSTLSGDQLPMNCQAPLLALSGAGVLTVDRIVLDAVRANGLDFRAGGFISGVSVQNMPSRFWPNFMANVESQQAVVVSDCVFKGPGPVRAVGPVQIVRSNIAAQDGLAVALSLSGASLSYCTLDLEGDAAFHFNNVTATDCVIESFSTFVANSITSGSLDRCTFDMRGGVQFEGAASVLNCVFQGLGGVGSSIFMQGGGSPNLVNCTIRVTAQPFFGEVVRGNSGWTISNCIVWHQNGFEAVAGTNGSNPVVNYSCIRNWSGNLGGQGNSGADPLLGVDGRLLAGSPSIDAGSNALVPPAATLDLARQCRITDGDANQIRTVDRGAYETAVCYPNCDCSANAPNVADFTCFLQRYAAGDPWANCDGSVIPPVLNVADFTCFLQRYAAGCS